MSWKALSFSMVLIYIIIWWIPQDLRIMHSFFVTCYRKVSKRYNLKRNAQKSFCKGEHFPKRESHQDWWVTGVLSSSYSRHMTQLPGENASSIHKSSLVNPPLRNKHVCKRANQKENSMSQLQQLLNSITIKIGVVSDRDPDIKTNLHNWFFLDNAPLKSPVQYYTLKSKLLKMIQKKSQMLNFSWCQLHWWEDIRCYVYI